MARPIPSVPPVTSATLPCNLPMLLLDPLNPSFPSASPTGIRRPHRREPSLPDRRPSAGNSPAPDHDAAVRTPRRGSSLTASSEERRRGLSNFSSARFAPKVNQGGTTLFGAYDVDRHDMRSRFGWR